MLIRIFTKIKNMDLYGKTSKSIPYKIIIHLLEIMLLYLSFRILFQGGGAWIENNFSISNGVGNVDRRKVVFAFNLIIFLRLSYMMIFLLRRKIPWDESVSVPFAFALYFIGFSLFVLPISKPLDGFDYFAIVVFAVGCILKIGRAHV